MVYKKLEHIQFVEDCEAAGFDTRFYMGRFFWRGPSVVCEDIQDVIRATEVPVQWDNMGFDFVVYPVVSDSSLEGDEY